MTAPTADARATAPVLPVREGGLTAIALVLSFAAGATDAFAFLQLGGIFTANMTGNLVLAGLFERPGFPVTLVGAAVAIVVFAAAAWIGFVLTRTARPRERRVVAALAVALGAQVVVLLLWLVLPKPLPFAATCLVIAVSTVAMAMQTVVGRRLETRSGITTTFVTGTLTSLMKSLADREHGVRLVRLGAVLLLTAGAACGAIAIGVAPTFGAALPILPSAAALIVLLADRRGA